MDFDLMLRFDREDSTFARGVEVGLLWQRLQNEPLPIEAVLHADNAEMAFRLAEARGVSVQANDSDGDWLWVTYR
jgi:hypothetical protein